MDFDYLQKLNYNNLRKIGEDMGISIPKKKEELIQSLTATEREKLDNYNFFKHNPSLMGKIIC